jgi:methionine-R-sulfoxide reductase
MNDKNESSSSGVAGVEELKLKLTPMQFHVTQEAGTERPFTGEYWDSKEPGTYHCIVCGTELFDSETKFDAHCGWPSFYKAIDDGRIDYIEDRSHGMMRTEVRCANCGAHLGHVFPDGPAPTGDRYCINSASLNLDRRPAASSS